MIQIFRNRFGKENILIDKHYALRILKYIYKVPEIVNIINKITLLLLLKDQYVIIIRYKKINYPVKVNKI
jgi:hypothetical protein